MREPHAAFSTHQLCDLVYGEIEVTDDDLRKRGVHPSNWRWFRASEKWPEARRKSIVRALRSMKLPDGWRYEATGLRQHFLFNARNRTSARCAETFPELWR